jgi:hypothetical protein
MGREHPGRPSQLQPPSCAHPQIRTSAPPARGDNPYSWTMEADTLAIVSTQLITALGILVYLSRRIDALGRDLRGEMSDQGGQLQGGITSQGRDLRREIASQGDQLRGEIASQGQQLRSEIAMTRTELAARLDAHIERHAG